MLCPVCRADNFEGEDNCGNCGADLRTSDVPQQALEYEDTVLGARLVGLVRDPSCVEPGLPAADAFRRMQADAVDCLLVCEGDRLVGIVTDRDAVVKAAGKALAGVSVRDVMTADPVVLRRDDTLAVAIHKMAVGGFRHIPVAVEGRAIGVVSAADVFRYLTAAIP